MILSLNLENKGAFQGMETWANQTSDFVTITRKYILSHI